MATRKKKTVEITRKEYGQIRKMDHSSMEGRIAGYYDRGYAAGYEAGRQQVSDSFDIARALEGISRIKGIGGVKLLQIRTVLIKAGAKDTAAGSRTDNQNEGKQYG